MKSQKGITLTSLAIYITIVLIVIGILAVITANFQGNIKEIYAEGTNNAEIDKFNVYFLKEVKKQGNAIYPIINNEILFLTGNKYTFNENEKSIYLNDSIKIAENIEKCIFSKNIVNEKTIITVTIKSINGEEKVIDYVLSNEIILGKLEEESNYINYVQEDWDLSKLNKETPVVVETFDNNVYVAPIPKGFEISGAVAESTVENGLVIYEMTQDEKEKIDWTDSEELENAKQTYNQFVWIPYISNIDYEEDDFGPLTATDNLSNAARDSQENLDYYYGINYYNYSDFNYAEDKKNIEESINKYNGFYIARYETSIDENGIIGSKKNSEVLTAYHMIETIQKYYRWYGLYKVQKDLYAQDEEVFSTMLTSKQWDKILDFIEYNNETRAAATYTTKPDLTGSKYKNTTNTYSLSKNIYDIVGNVFEWTLMAPNEKHRQYRGSYYNNSDQYATFFSNAGPSYIDEGMITVGSRVSLYIK